MAKKRKLGSSNPKYKKNVKEKYRREFVAEVKGVKIYKSYEI